MPVRLGWHQFTMLRSVRATPAVSNIRATSRTVSVWFSLRSERCGLLRKLSASFQPRRKVRKLAERFRTLRNH